MSRKKAAGEEKKTQILFNPETKLSESVNNLIITKATSSTLTVLLAYSFGFTQCIDPIYGLACKATLCDLPKLTSSSTETDTPLTLALFDRKESNFEIPSFRMIRI